VDGVRDILASAALAAADAALAQAEASAASPGHAGVVDLVGAGGGPTGGARAWRDQINTALAEGRTQLAATPMIDRQGREIHLECALRVQMQPGGVFQGAERWLALARRSRLMPQVDLAAIGLGLQAIHEDGRARAVHVSPLSLAMPGFFAEVAARLAAAPVAARRLAIECVDGLRPGAGPTVLAAAVAAWSPWGVRVGVEHAAYSAQQLPALGAAGVHHVKVDLRQLQGLAGDSAVQEYAHSLLALLHGLGLQVLAVGLTEQVDMAALWALGFDGASAPA
jgi:EAL domain-containing protein (putative c-di-GMP-specific phosphodiesterase class I)